MARVTEELNFKFYLILTNLISNSHMWLVATILDSAVLDVTGDIAAKSHSVFFMPYYYLYI